MKNRKFRKNLFYEVILESVIEYDTKFKNLLKEVDSPLSTKILSLIGKNLQTRNNYYALTDKNDTIKYLQDKKYQGFKNEIGGLWYSVNSSWAGFGGGPGAPPPQPNQNPEIRFDAGDRPYLPIRPNNENRPPRESATTLIWKGVGLSMPPHGNEIYRDGGQPMVNQYRINSIVGTIGDKNYTSTRSGKTYVAFYPLSKYGLIPIPKPINSLRKLTEENIDLVIDNSAGFQEMKVGRGIKALLTLDGVNTTDKEIEDFINKFKAAYDMSQDIFNHFDMVQGEELRKFYLEYSYREKKGSLGQSCMRYPNCQPFFDMYVKNPDNVKMLILRSDDKEKILGRALIWKLDDGRTFMDRIYTSRDSDVNLFKEFAKRNKWYCKRQQNQGNTGLVGPDGNNCNNFNMIVTLKNKNFDTYPYLDSLKFYLIKEGKLENYNPIDKMEIKKGQCLELSQSDGTTRDIRSCRRCNGREIVDCESCGGTGKRTCYECDGNGKRFCGDCGGTGIKRITCPYCNGKRYLLNNKGERIKCSFCHNGKIEDPKKSICDRCQGKKIIHCDECEGSGKLICGDCEGEGTVPCYDCQ